MGQKKIYAYNKGDYSKEDVKFFIRFLDKSISQVYDLAEKIEPNKYEFVKIDLPENPKPMSIFYLWKERFNRTAIFRYADLIREKEYQGDSWEGAIISWDKFHMSGQSYEGFYGGISGAIGEIEKDLPEK